MKKVIIVLLVMLTAMSLAFAFDTGRFSVGLSFGIAGSSEKSTTEGVQVSSGKFGFVVRLRADYMINDALSATLMVSYDQPSRTVLESTYLKSRNSLESLKYIKIFAGISKYSMQENMMIAAGLGPELAIELTGGSVGGGAVTYVRTSYLLPGANLTVDSTAVGGAEWIKDLPDDETHFYLDGDASIGFTYYFKPSN